MQTTNDVQRCIDQFPGQVCTTWYCQGKLNEYLIGIAKKAQEMQTAMKVVESFYTARIEDVDRENCDFSVRIVDLEQNSERDAGKILVLKTRVAELEADNEGLRREQIALENNNDFLGDSVVEANNGAMMMRESLVREVQQLREAQKESVRLIHVKHAHVCCDMAGLFRVVQAEQRAFASTVVKRFADVDKCMQEVNQVFSFFVDSIKDQQIDFGRKTSVKVFAMERAIKQIADETRAKIAGFSRKTGNAIARADAKEAEARDLRRSLDAAEKNLRKAIHSAQKRDEEIAGEIQHREDSAVVRLLGSDYAKVMSELRIMEQQVDQLRAEPGSEPVRKLQDSNKKLVQRCVEQMREITALKAQCTQLGNLLAILRRTGGTPLDDVVSE